MSKLDEIARAVAQRLAPEIKPGIGAAVFVFEKEGEGEKELVFLSNAPRERVIGFVLQWFQTQKATTRYPENLVALAREEGVDAHEAAFASAIAGALSSLIPEGTPKHVCLGALTSLVISACEQFNVTPEQFADSLRAELEPPREERSR